MLAEIIKAEEQKRQEWQNKLVAQHRQQYEKMVVLKSELEKVSDGCLQLNIKFAEPTRENINNSYLPCLEVVNVRGIVNINNTIDDLRVSGLGIFSLCGERHSVESFFRKIAPYLKRF